MQVIESGLITLLDQELSGRYPGQVINGIDHREFEEAGGQFFVARSGDEIVGCGAYRPVDNSTIEIKRMFVAPPFRGRGVARALLSAIEGEGRRNGFSRSVLETGNLQPEAIALYQACGYTSTKPFGQYVVGPRSVFLGKLL